jgi:hypothetical protein
MNNVYKILYNRRIINNEILKTYELEILVFKNKQINQSLYLKPFYDVS